MKKSLVLAAVLSGILVSGNAVSAAHPANPSEVNTVIQQLLDQKLTADVVTDLAIKAGLSLEQIVRGAIALDGKQSPAILESALAKASPAEYDLLVVAAVEVAPASEHAGLITVAVKSGMTLQGASTAALIGGADPVAAFPAPAGGPVPPGFGFGFGGGGFGWGGGGGGGGGFSAN